MLKGWKKWRSKIFWHCAPFILYPGCVGVGPCAHCKKESNSELTKIARSHWLTFSEIPSWQTYRTESDIRPTITVQSLCWHKVCLCRPLLALNGNVQYTVTKIDLDVNHTNQDQHLVLSFYKLANKTILNLCCIFESKTRVLVFSWWNYLQNCFRVLIRSLGCLE